MAGCSGNHRHLGWNGNWTVTRVWPPCGDANPDAFIDLTGPSSDLELARELEAMLRGESWTVTSPVRETGDVLFAAESAVVGAGDDHVADGGLVSIGELDF